MKRNKCIGTLVIVMVVFILFAGGCGSKNTPSSTANTPSSNTPSTTTTTSAPIELHFSHITSPVHHLHVEVYDPFAKEVEAKTDGRVKIIIHTGASLTPANEHYESAASGIVDIAHVVLGYTPGRFPLAEVVELPFMFQSSQHAIKTLTELYQTVPEFRNQFNDVKILWFGSLDPGQFLTTAPVKSIGDIKGKKLRSPGPMQNKVVEILGGIPISMPITDVYDSIDRGIIDGAVTTASTIDSYRLDEVVKYVAMGDIYIAPQAVVMNWGAWNKLSPEDQQIIEEIAGRYGAIHGESYDHAGFGGIDTAKAKNLDIYYFTDTQIEEANRLLAPLVEEWIKDMEKKGYPGREIYETTIAIRDKYKD